MTRHSLDEIKAAASGRWVDVLDAVAFIPPDVLDGRKHPCPRCGGRDRFRFIDAAAGACYCNQCFSEKNGDGIAAVQWKLGIDFPTACERIVAHLHLGNGHATNISADKGSGQKPATVFPTREAAASAAASWAGGTVADQWEYHAATGNVVAVVVRVNLPTPEGEKQRKEFRPITPFADGWIVKGLDAERPLYRLADVVQADRVFVCEGEKAADAGRSIGLVTTTSMSGAKAARKTDWRPLAGKDVVLLPDNDQDGAAYAGTVASILSKLDPPAVVRVVELPDLPPKGDLFDFLESRESAEPDDLRIEIERLAAAAPASGGDTALPALPALPALIAHTALIAHSPEDSPADAPWPDSIGDDALYGLAGDVVRAIDPHTEADPVAILVQFLVAFGSVVGRSAHFTAEASRHYLNLFSVLVGQTSKGRKGTSWNHVARLYESIDDQWNVMGGLSSGEGLIWAVRDPIFKREPVKNGKQIMGYQDVESDPGVSDKRLLVLESEFASVLNASGRERNTLSAVIRQAWDSGNLRTITKNSPAQSTNAHISIVGHVTKDELRKLLQTVDQSNGFANRFLWLCVKRSKCLPEGGAIHTVNFSPILYSLREAVEFTRRCDEIKRDDDARFLWHEVYPSLSEGKPGLLGGILSRSEAQVMRLATLHACLDLSSVIRVEHLKAALSLWCYCEASAAHIFGDSTGDRTADVILSALRSEPNGLTRNDIREMFHGHRSSAEIGQALETLKASSLAHCVSEQTGGRPIERWLCGPAR